MIGVGAARWMIAGSLFAFGPVGPMAGMGSADWASSAMIDLMVIPPGKAGWVV